MSNARGRIRLNGAAISFLAAAFLAAVGLAVAGCGTPGNQARGLSDPSAPDIAVVDPQPPGVEVVSPACDLEAFRTWAQRRLGMPAEVRCQDQFFAVLIPKDAPFAGSTRMAFVYTEGGELGYAAAAIYDLQQCVAYPNTDDIEVPASLVDGWCT